MTQVFISYSRKDLDFVEKLAADLQAAGLDVWYDLSGLEVGERWQTEISTAIRDSQYLIVVLSKSSVVSEWVEREYLLANQLGLKIIPLYYKRCDLPLYFLSRHYIDVRGKNYEQNYEEILRTFDVQLATQKKLPKFIEKGSASDLSEASQSEKPKPRPEQRGKTQVLYTQAHNLKVIFGSVLLFGIANLLGGYFIGIDLRLGMALALISVIVTLLFFSYEFVTRYYGLEKVFVFGRNVEKQMSIKPTPLVKKNAFKWQRFTVATVVIQTFIWIVVLILYIIPKNGVITTNLPPDVSVSYVSSKYLSVGDQNSIDWTVNNLSPKKSFVGTATLNFHDPSITAAPVPNPSGRMSEIVANLAPGDRATGREWSTVWS